MEDRRQKVAGIRILSFEFLFLSGTNKFDRPYRQFFGSEGGGDAASNTPNRRSTLTRAIDNLSIFCEFGKWLVVNS